MDGDTEDRTLPCQVYVHRSDNICVNHGVDQAWYDNTRVNVVYFKLMPGRSLFKCGSPRSGTCADGAARARTAK